MIVAVRIWLCEFRCACVSVRMWMCEYSCANVPLQSGCANVAVRMWKCKADVCMRYTPIKVLAKYYLYQKKSLQ